MILEDVFLVCALAKEYLSAKKERKNYISKRNEWEKHIQQLA